MYDIINIGDDMEPIHIEAKKEEIANKVLLPGDPLRAKYIAEKFLTDVKLVNDIRNMFAFTGYYKNERITVMGSGMGIPSVGIYAYELYNFYDVEKIIRIGSSGSLNESVKVLDIVLSTAAYSKSSFAYTWNKTTDTLMTSSLKLNKTILNTANELGIKNIKFGTTLTSDVFDVYTNIDHIIEDSPFKDELMCVEMEGFGLMFIANICQKEAAMLATVVDSKYEPNHIVTPEERETSLDEMIILALESIIR